jgi:ATP-dependent protease HslVU (ClpYQ) peptidase subunit
MQESVLGSLVKSKIDEIISSFPEIKDVKSIDDFTAYIENFKEAQIAGGQKGGGQLTSIIIFLFLLMVLSTPSSASWLSSKTQKEEPIKDVAVIQGKPGEIVVKNPGSGLLNYNTNMIADKTGMAVIDVNKFELTISELPTDKSRDYDLSTAVRVWSPKETNKIKKLFTKIMVFLGMDKAGPENGSDVLDRVIKNFNDKSEEFSDGAEKQCLELMKKTYDNDAFRDFQDYSNASEIINQINEFEKKLQDSNNNLEKSAVEVLSDTATGAAIGSVVPVVGTGIGAGIGFLSSTAVNVYKYVKNTKETANKITAFKSTALDPYSKLTVEQRRNLEEQAYAFSKVYCSYGFKLTIERTNDNIQVIGNNVNYQYMINLIDTLKSNIDLSITTKIGKSENDNTIAILDSLHQRLEVLTAISSKISDVVNFQANAKLTSLLKRGDSQTISKIETYFDQQISSLNELLSQVKQARPLSLQKELDILNDKKAKLIERNVKAEGEGVDRDIVILNTENSAQNSAVSYNSTMTGFKGDVKNFLAPGVGILSGTSSAVGDAATEILKGIFGNYLTFALVGGGITILALAGYALSGQAFMFKTAAGGIWWVIASPFKGAWWVCKKIFSPIYGWIYKPVGIVVAPGAQAVGPGQGPPAVVQGPEPQAVVPGPGAGAVEPYCPIPGAQNLDINDIDGGRKTRKIRKLRKRISKNKTKKRISKNKTKKRILKVRRRRLTKHRK